MSQLTNLLCEWQEINLTSMIQNGNRVIDMKQVLPTVLLGRITEVDDGSYNPKTGIWTLPSTEMLESSGYEFDVKWSEDANERMNVTVAITYSSDVLPPEPKPEPKPEEKPTQKKNQVISASNVTKTIGDKPFYVGAKRTVGDGALSYTSSNPKVATIASNGKITLKGTGTTNITIRAGATSTYNAASKTIKLTVKPRMVSSIKLSAPSTKIAAGKKVKLTAQISPSYASNKGLKWKSSNKKVAKVDSKGNVTFSKKAGGKKVTITAYAKDGSGKKKSYKFTVMKGSVKKVSISGAKSVKAGKSLKLKAKVSASKGANKKMKWKSSNTKYAKVSSSGKVTTYKKGRGKKVKITVYAVDGSNKKKTVTIKTKQFVKKRIKENP